MKRPSGSERNLRSEKSEILSTAHRSVTTNRLFALSVHACYTGSPRTPLSVQQSTLMKATDEPIVIHQTMSASREVVWTALTEVDKMREWYFENIPAFEPTTGFEVRFDVQSNGRTFTHVWTVTRVDPKTAVAYRWQYEEYDGDSTVQFELSESDDGTLVVLTHTPKETFPQEIPEFDRDACYQGWDYFIKTALKDFVDNG